MKAYKVLLTTKEGRDLIWYTQAKSIKAAEDKFMNGGEFRSAAAILDWELTAEINRVNNLNS